MIQINRFIFYVIISFFYLFLTPLHTAAENRALIIGVGQYKISSISLPGINKDVKMMHEFARLTGFKDSQIKILKNTNATLDKIKSSIDNWLVKGVNYNDRVLFYFSGHGSYIPDTNGDEHDGKDEVLLPHDMKIGPNTLINTFVDDNFNKMLAKIPAQEVFVIIDACHSGTATKSLDLVHNEYPKFFQYPGMSKGVFKGDFAVREFVKPNKYIGLSACKDIETAIATKQGSLFTKGIYEAVKKAASQNKKMSLTNLKETSTHYIAQKVSSDKAHHPQIYGNKSLAVKNIFLSKTTESALPKTTWEKLEELTANADYNLIIHTNKSSYKLGELLKITCIPDRSGYINILNINPENTKATILFPNSFHQDNYIQAGTKITIPDEKDQFELPASPPLGKSMIIVFQTQKKINTYQQGSGKSQDLFKLMSESSYTDLKNITRGFTVQKKQGKFGAAKIITNIIE